MIDSKYMVGQMVQIVFPSGSTGHPTPVTVIGMLEERSNYSTPWLFVPGVGGWLDPSNNSLGRVVTILKQPRPKEPQGLGAVVEASIDRASRSRWTAWFNYGANGARWRSEYGENRHWDDLIDPVVLSDGLVK